MISLVLMEIFICHPVVVISMCLWFILQLPLIGGLLPSHLGLLWVEKLKNNLYLQRAQVNGSKFYPVVFESFGAIGPRAREFIRPLNDEAGTHSIYNLYGLTVM